MFKQSLLMIGCILVGLFMVLPYTNAGTIGDPVSFPADSDEWSDTDALIEPTDANQSVATWRRPLPVLGSTLVIDTTEKVAGAGSIAHTSQVHNYTTFFVPGAWASGSFAPNLYDELVFAIKIDFGVLPPDIGVLSVFITPCWPSPWCVSIPKAEVRWVAGEDVDWTEVRIPVSKFKGDLSYMNGGMLGIVIGIDPFGIDWGTVYIDNFHFEYLTGVKAGEITQDELDNAIGGHAHDKGSGSRSTGPGFYIP